MKVVLLISFSFIILIACNKSSSPSSVTNSTIKTSSEIWIKSATDLVKNVDLILPSKFEIYRLNLLEMIETLDLAQKDIQVDEIKLIIDFPFPNKEPQAFKIRSTTVMAPELAEKYPELKTYEGVAVTTTANTIRISRNKTGIDAMISTPEGTIFIDPIELNDTIYYLVYYKRDYINPNKNRFFEPSRK